MLSLLNTDLLTDLFLLNACFFACFAWIYHNYFHLMDRLEAITVTAKFMDEKQKILLKRYFGYYNKLSPNLQRVFEQKLLYFYYTKEYQTVLELELHERMKLFISAYAAQVSLGFKNYGFSHIYKIRIYPGKFYSHTKQEVSCWELDSEGVLHLSWKDFFGQMRREVVLPLGLEIMAHAIKKDENELLKDQIYSSRNLLFQQLSGSDPSAAVRELFAEDDLLSREDFMEACIKNYFGCPAELKNNFPDLFKKIDKLLFSQLRLG